MKNHNSITLFTVGTTQIHPYTNISSFNELFEKVVKAHLLIFKGYHAMICQNREKEAEKKFKKEAVLGLAKANF